LGRIRIQNGCRTAVTGKFVVPDSAGAAGLADAVAASCAVPGGMAAF
jgi:predicted acylesterase/phospholipase RssA